MGPAYRQSRQSLCDYSDSDGRAILTGLAKSAEGTRGLQLHASNLDAIYASHVEGLKGHKTPLCFIAGRLG